MFGFGSLLSQYKSIHQFCGDRIFDFSLGRDKPDFLIHALKATELDEIFIRLFSDLRKWREANSVGREEFLQAGVLRLGDRLNLNVIEFKKMI